MRFKIFDVVLILVAVIAVAFCITSTEQTTAKGVDSGSLFINEYSPAIPAITPETPAPTPDVSSFRPSAGECNCEDCLDETEVRRIVRDEMSKFRTQYQTIPATAATSSGGSTGVAMSSGSTGGSLQTVASPIASSQPGTVSYRTVTPQVTRSVQTSYQTTCENGICTTRPVASGSTMRSAASGSTTSTTTSYRLFPRILPRIFGR